MHGAEAMSLALTRIAEARACDPFARIHRARVRVTAAQEVAALVILLSTVETEGP